uniref:EF-hand domain-containing protein n=1 Tax=Schlesneria paludicola TaxID=360056 RepID=A0A7C2PCM6_9PLAN
MLVQRLTISAGLAAVLAMPSLLPAQNAGPTPAELFQKLDKNGDGELTADEVSDDQKRFFDRSVRVGDKNNDGKLSQDEFVQANQPQENPSVPLAPAGGDRGGPAELRQRFEMMDRNKDGKLSKDEIPEPLRDRLAQVFERLGRDEINLEEFGRFAGGAPGGRGQFDPGQLFQRFDANSDGKLTRDEIPEPMRERFAQVFERLGRDALTREDFAEATRQVFGQGGRPDGNRPGDGPMGGRPPVFFRLVDTDGDGRLSKDELARAADKFAELDRNSDGAIDPSELFGGPPPGMAFGGGRPDMPRPDGRPLPDGPGSNPFFARMDQNGDGKISREEAPERMRDGFDRMDRNGDGYLTQEELQAAFQSQQRGPRSGQPDRPDDNPNRPRRPMPE